MKYEVEFKPRTIKDLRKIEKAYHKKIITRISELANNLSGNVKRLTNFTPEYRLHVGNYRVLFEIEGKEIVIYRIRHRREAYR